MHWQPSSSAGLRQRPSAPAASPVKPCLCQHSVPAARAIAFAAPLPLLPRADGCRVDSPSFSGAGAASSKSKKQEWPFAGVSLFAVLVRVVCVCAGLRPNLHVIGQPRDRARCVQIQCKMRYCHCKTPKFSGIGSKKKGDSSEALFWTHHMILLPLLGGRPHCRVHGGN